MLNLLNSIQDRHDVLCGHVASTARLWSFIPPGRIPGGIGKESLTLSNTALQVCQATFWGREREAAEKQVLLPGSAEAVSGLLFRDFRQGKGSWLSR